MTTIRLELKDKKKQDRDLLRAINYINNRIEDIVVYDAIQTHIDELRATLIDNSTNRTN